MAVISVRQLGKEYKLGAQMHDTLRDQIVALFRGGKKRAVEKFWALRDVDFDVEQGGGIFVGSALAAPPAGSHNSV